jgi:hypothetical protein
MSNPSPRTVAPPPCLSVDIKDLLKEGMRLFDGGFGRLPLAAGYPPEQLSVPRTLYIGFRKAEH